MKEVSTNMLELIIGFLSGGIVGFMACALIMAGDDDEGKP